MRIRYFESEIEVQLGDQIQTRLWYVFRRRGRVGYLPGASPYNSEFDHHGLKWVGVVSQGGAVFGEVVEPQTGFLPRWVKFIQRDTSSLTDVLKSVPRRPANYDADEEDPRTG